MKTYHVFESDSKFIVLEVLQHNGRFFSKKVNEFLSLDLAQKCATMLNEDGVAGGVPNTSGGGLALGIGKAEGGTSNVDGRHGLLIFSKKKKKAKDMLARRNKPRL